MNDMTTFVRVAKAVSDPGRVKILKMLEQREMCACEIVAALELAQPTVSKHLKQLVDADLIRARKDGAWMHYRLAGDGANEGAQSAAGSAMLQLVRSLLNDDPDIVRLHDQLPILSPERLKCPR